MKKIRIIPLLCILIICLSLTSCSYKDFEDRLMGRNVKMGYNNTGEFDQYGGIDWRRVKYIKGEPFLKNGELIFHVIDVSKIELKKTDEPIKITHIDVDYTIVIHQKHIHKNLESAGIPLSEMNKYYVDKVIDTTSLPKNWSLVVVDLTVKNTSQIKDDEGLNVSRFRITEKRLINSESSGEIAYFSEHGVGETDYYHWVLEPGEEITAQIGWFIDTSTFNVDQVILEIEDTNPIFITFNV